MASSKWKFKAPTSVKGKHARFEVGGYIDGGGNGAVYHVKCEEHDEFFLNEESMVIKFMAYNSTQGNEVEKRRERFNREIEKVLSVQDKVEGVIPIYDYCNEKDRRSGLYWYVMPEASEYKSQGISIEQRLYDLIGVAKTLKQLHTLGYAHRDIKPGNLLLYKNRLCLADFGLAFNPNEDKHITDMGEKIGPRGIRPPEFEMAGELGDFDYRVSDIYLFAKTVWMILRASPHGFVEEYDRNNPEISLQGYILDAKTIEPIHRMMEGATKREAYNRISIDECISFLESQLGICNNTISEKQIQMWKYDEKMSLINMTVYKDMVTYFEKNAIISILKNLSGIAPLRFFEAGRLCNVFQLKSVNLLDDRINLEISGLTAMGYVRKKIAVNISEICVTTKDKSCEIHLEKNLKLSENDNCFMHINDAMDSSYSQIDYVGDGIIRINREN